MTVYYWDISTCTDITHTKGTHHGRSTCNDSLFWSCFSPLTAFNFPEGPTTLTKNQPSKHNEVEGKITYDKRMPMLSKVVAATFTLTGRVCASMRDRQWMWDAGPPMTWHIHSCQQEAIGLKFSKSQTKSDVRYSCHHNSSRFTFPIFAHSCRFSVLHSLQSITPHMY